jgi:hypothetical protein
MQPETPDTAPHGTYAALIAHRARKEEPCEICRRAGALYMKAYRNRDKCAPMATGEVIVRPNGKPYRPRKVTARPVADADEMASGVMVLGTHDIERARKLANECAADWVDGGHVATEPETGWFREGYASGRPMWLRDEVHGRAGVWFREIVEVSP